jgi:hypothetical protein
MLLIAFSIVSRTLKSSTGDYVLDIVDVDTVLIKKDNFALNSFIDKYISFFTFISIVPRSIELRAFVV